MNVENLRARLEQELDRLPKVTGPTAADKIYVTQRLNNLFTRAEDEAKRLKDDFNSVEHFLLGAAEDSKLLKELGTKRDKLMQALRKAPRQSPERACSLSYTLPVIFNRMHVTPLADKQSLIN